MANITNFNSLNLTISLPSNFKKWTTIGHMFGSKWVPIIPPDFLPLETITIGENIFYNIIIPTSSGSLGISGGVGIIGALGAINAAAVGDIGGFFTADINLSRAGSYGQFGLKQHFDYYSSPRFGYQIGDLKQQAYFKIRSFGTALSTLGTLAWLNFDTIPQIEYVTNSRFKKMYLMHGKIQEIKEEYKDVFYIKLYNFVQSPSVNFKLDGKMDVWSKKTTNTTENNYIKTTLFLSKSQITDNGYLIFFKKDFPDIDKISAGDFFVLDKPWVLEDYSLLFEYGLSKDNGFYETEEQRISRSSGILGVWIQWPKELTINGVKETMSLWHLYTNMDKENIVLPTTPRQEKLMGESSEIAGWLNEGIDLLKEKNGDSIRVLFQGGGLHNFKLPTLVGEFVKTNDYYFEIVGHPRNDTIEISTNSANAGDLLLSANLFDLIYTGVDGDISLNMDVFQQKFWFINELYYNHPYSFGLWEGEIISVINGDYKQEITETHSDGLKSIKKIVNYDDSQNRNRIESKTINISSPAIVAQEEKKTVFTSKKTNIKLKARDVLSTFILSDKEKTNTGCNYLTEKFYRSFFLKPLLEKDDNILLENFYKKYGTWRFYNKANGNIYEILNASVNVIETNEIFTEDSFYNNSRNVQQNPSRASSEGFILGLNIEISLTLDGDFSREIEENDTGYIFLDTPHATLSGNYGEMSFFVQTIPSLDVNGQYYILMYGNYYSGIYLLSEPVEFQSQFLLDDFAYGDSVTSGGGDIPDVYISTYDMQNTFISGCTERIGNSKKDYLFFVEPSQKWVVYRTGCCIWRFEQQGKLVVTMEPKKLEAKDMQSIKQLEKIVTQVVYNVDKKDEAYWFARPPTKLALSPYESYYVSESSNVNTVLMRLYNLEKLSSMGVWFPFEFFSSENKLDENQVENNVVVDTYFTSDLLGSGEHLEKIYGQGVDTSRNLTSIVRGEPFSLGPPSSSVKTISYVDSNKTLQNINYMWAYSTKSAEIYLFYNTNPPEFYIEDIAEPTELNPSRPSVFVLRSNNSGGDFYSPSVMERDKSSASTPLMILYDFDLRCVVINEQETSCFLFGFAYERGKGPADKNEDETPVNYTQNCFLAMYCFNLNDVFSKDNLFLLSDRDGQEKWIARFPKLKSQTLTKESNEYGESKDLFGHILKEVEAGILEDYNEISSTTDESSQYLISILNQTDAKFEPQQISITSSSAGIMTLFMNVKDFKYSENIISGIISLTSNNNGITWVVSVDSNNSPIVYSGNDLQTNPYQLGRLLFVIDNLKKQLIVKYIEEKIIIRTNVVASDVSQQNIYATRKDNGEIYVYHYDVNGNVVASFSSNDGMSWKLLNNW